MLVCPIFVETVLMLVLLEILLSRPYNNMWVGQNASDPFGAVRCYQNVQGVQVIFVAMLFDVPQNRIIDRHIHHHMTDAHLRCNCPFIKTSEPLLLMYCPKTIHKFPIFPVFGTAVKNISLHSHADNPDWVCQDLAETAAEQTGYNITAELFAP